jgi:hypothetical protein
MTDSNATPPQRARIADIIRDSALRNRRPRVDTGIASLRPDRERGIRRRQRSDARSQARDAIVFQPERGQNKKILAPLFAKTNEYLALFRS